MLLLLMAIENDDDREFLSELYEQYYPIMKKKAYEITQDYHSVDDIINDSFIKLISKISILRSLDCCKRTSYIVHTIRNKSFDYLKHKNVEKNRNITGEDEDLAEQIADTAYTAEELYIQKEEAEYLGQLMSRLSERDRDLLYNKYIFELSYKEISELMGIPVNNIREYLVRARARAMKLLRDSYQRGE